MSNHPFASIEEIFRAYDIRGLLEQVSPELAFAAAYTLTKEQNAKTVLIGRDMRANSPELLEAAVKGVHAAGAKAVVIGLCSTSLFNYAVTAGDEIDAGIMITASHNPAKYNGIKMADHKGMPMTGRAMFELLTTYEKPEEKEGEMEERNVVDEYITHFMKLAGLSEGSLTGMKVVVDFGNGMGSVTLMRALELLGVEANYLYEELDADFPNHEANPAKHDTLKDLRARVQETGAALGIATDGDADRIGFIDNTGRILRGDQTLGLLTELLAKDRQIGTVITAPNFGWDALSAIENAGGALKEVRIGRTNVIDAMEKERADIGGEISSHFFFKETKNLEAVDYVAMLILKGAHAHGGAFSEMINHLYTYVNSGEMNFMVEDKPAAIARVKESLQSEATTVNELDGLRLEFQKDWWFILRPSNTEPLLRLTVEAKTHEMLQEKIAFMRELVGGEQEY